MYILGISAFYHDSAACLVRDGDIIAAAQEERFTRKKHDFNFPSNAVRYCLDEGNISVQDLDYVSFYEKPFLKFERILETYLAIAPRGWKSYVTAIKLWLTKKLWMKEIIKEEIGYEGEIIFPEHHESHAASAFFPSPFQEAAILTMDGVGEWATTTIGLGKGNQIKVVKEICFPHSLGLLYSAFTYHAGFRVNSGEYKVMGLAPYGEPKYVDTILNNLVNLKDDGSFKLNMRYFGYIDGFAMTNEKFDQLFGGPARSPEGKMTQREMDLARSIQEVTEEIMLRVSRYIYKETKLTNLCLAGGVALNCVANGRILREGPIEDIWIQPAAGDAGGAVGAALFIWYQYLGNTRHPQDSDFMKGAYLGPGYSEEEIEGFLNRIKAPYVKLSEEQLLEQVTELLQEGHAIGWFQGRMEFGPRALGNRSIIADARNVEMQKKLNLKIKFRESFRPFAPSVLREDTPDYFEIDYDSPYMLLVADVKKERRCKLTEEQKTYFGIDKLNVVRSEIPAVTHIDYSARLQTVHKETNPKYHKLISKFKERTDCPVIVNTSFNVRGEPIVCSPEDAYTCFMRTEMDYLVLERFLLDKNKQPKVLPDIDWKRELELD